MSGVGEASAAAGTVDVELAPLPLGWCWATLADLAAPEKNAVTDGPFGSNLKTTHYTDAGPRVIRLQNVGDSVFKDARAHISETHYASLSRHSAQPGDLVIAALGEDLPRACVIPGWLGPAVVKADCIRFRPNTKAVHAQFLNYALNSSDTRRRTAEVVHGVGRPRLTLGQIRSICVPVAPFGLQLRISDTLDELLSDLDAGVAALERARAKLELYRASVLKAAVEGALTAEWRAQHPSVEPASDLLDRILAERRRLWEERQLAKFKAKDQQPPKSWRAKYKEPSAPDTTDLVALPGGWCWVSFDQIGDIQGGLQKSPSREPRKNHYPYLRVANVRRGGLDLSEVQRFELAREELDRLRLHVGDILIVEGNGSRSEIGRCALWWGEIADCVHQNHIIRVRPITGLLPKYADIVLNSPTGQRAIQDVASSTSGLYTLSIGKIERLPLPLPPFAEQQAVVDAVEDLLSVIEHVETDIDAKLKSAQTLRQAILRHAFSGKLVPQNPNDEPASELLKRIAAERQAQAGEAAAVKRPGKPPQRRARSN